MKVIGYVRLGECAICLYSFKKESGKLKCNWREDKKNAENCLVIKKCGHFPTLVTIDVSKLEVDC